MLHRSLGSAGALLAALTIAACSTDTAGPDPSEDELVTTLDALTQEANQEGDVDASAAFSSAAQAARFGIRPTPIEVTFDDRSERYLAFVHVVTHAARDGRPIRLRTMVAYQGERRPERVLYVASLGDSGALGRPTVSLDRRQEQLQHAWASWKDLVNRQIWVGTAGKAGIHEQEIGGACPKPPPVANVQCTLGKFAVMLDGEFHRLTGDARDQIDPARRMTIATRAGDVNGAVLVFSGAER
jgi:hypothetical protein